VLRQQPGVGASCAIQFAQLRPFPQLTSVM
jgi:hypothetical protein